MRTQYQNFSIFFSFKLLQIIYSSLYKERFIVDFTDHRNNVTIQCRTEYVQETPADMPQNEHNNCSAKFDFDLEASKKSGNYSLTITIGLKSPEINFDYDIKKQKCFELDGQLVSASQLDSSDSTGRIVSENRSNCFFNQSGGKILLRRSDRIDGRERIRYSQIEILKK